MKKKREKNVLVLNVMCRELQSLHTTVLFMYFGVKD